MSAANDIIGTKPLSEEDYKRLEDFFEEESKVLNTLTMEEGVNQFFKTRVSEFLRNRVLILGNASNFGLRRSEILQIKLGQLYDFESKQARTTLRILGRTLKKKSKVDTNAVLLQEIRTLRSKVEGIEPPEEMKTVPRKLRLPPSRDIPLTARVRKWIEDLVKYWFYCYKRKPGPTEWAFQSSKIPDNRPISIVAYHKAFKKCLSLAGIQKDKYGTHSMRKTVANLIYNKSNKDIAVTARFLGHSNVQSTMSYVQTNRDVRGLLE